MADDAETPSEILAPVRAATEEEFNAARSIPGSLTPVALVFCDGGKPTGMVGLGGPPDLVAKIVEWLALAAGVPDGAALQLAGRDLRMITIDASRFGLAAPDGPARA